jgi:hypothetical protein
MKIRDLMTAKPIIVDSDTAVLEAGRSWFSSLN